jgi:hypothetical protein
MNKIFVIGYNKTASTTLHNIFIKNNLKSQHGKVWDVENFDCFSDQNSNSLKWKEYYYKYPSSVFILNTRDLRKWIISRFKHCYLKKFKWGFPPTEELVEKWINSRNIYFYKILKFFKKDPNRLIIVNIDQKNWINFVCKFLEIKSYNIMSNVNKIEFNTLIIKNLNSLIDIVYEKLGINKEPVYFIVDNYFKNEIKNLLKLYLNNLR